MELYRSHVLVCGGTGCTSSGSAKLIERFEEQLKEKDDQLKSKDDQLKVQGEQLVERDQIIDGLKKQLEELENIPK